MTVMIVVIRSIINIPKVFFSPLRINPRLNIENKKIRINILKYFAASKYFWVYNISIISSAMTKQKTTIGIVMLAFFNTVLRHREAAFWSLPVLQKTAIWGMTTLLIDEYKIERIGIEIKATE